MESSSFMIQLPKAAAVKISVFPAPKNTDAPIILLLPAMGVKAAYYLPFIEGLTEANLVVVSMDLRGLGASSIRPSSKVDWGYLEMIEDLKTVVDQIKNKFPNRPIYGLGHSLGGQIACLGQAKYPNLLNGIVLVAANSVYYKTWAGKQKYFNLLGYYVFPLISRLVGYFPGHKVGFGGKAAKTQLIDWAHVGRTGKYKVIGDELDYEAALKRISMPVLAVYVEGDWLSPKAAINHLCEKFNESTPISHFTLTRAAAGTKLNHFNWVKHGKAIVKAVEKWL